MPPGLENSAFPKDFALQPDGGEFVMGVFKAEGGMDAFFLANHNAYAEQSVTLKLRKAAKLSHFDGPTGRCQPLPAANHAVAPKLVPASGALLRAGD